MGTVPGGDVAPPLLVAQAGGHLDEGHAPVGAGGAHDLGQPEDAAVLLVILLDDASEDGEALGLGHPASVAVDDRVVDPNARTTP